MIDISHEYKKRPRAFLGAAIIALSFLAAIAISSAANRSVEVWSLRSAQPAGVQISGAALQKVKVYLPDNLARYFPARENIVGRILTAGVGAGELIPRTSVALAGHSLTFRQVPIKIGKVDLPSDLQGNDLVDLYLLPRSSSSSSSSSKTSDASGGAELIARAIRVISVDNRARDLGGDVGLLCSMDEGNISAFLSAYSRGRIVVVRHGS